LKYVVQLRIALKKIQNQWLVCKKHWNLSVQLNKDKGEIVRSSEDYDWLKAPLQSSKGLGTKLKKIIILLFIIIFPKTKEKMSKYPLFNPNFSLIFAPHHTNLVLTYILVLILKSKLKFQLLLHWKHLQIFC